MSLTTRRPRFLDLRKIKLPLPGVVSILHRVSGVLLVMAIPAGIYLLELSLDSEQGYHQAVEYTHTPLFRLAATLMLWSLSHHLFAGIRFLLLDLDIAIERSQARATSVAVFAASIMTTLLFLGVIW